MTGYRIIFFIHVILSSLLSSNPGKTKEYNLAAPDAKVALPAILHEISGITSMDDATVACVQDENGIIFMYDLKKKQISRQYTFHIDGDYEEITRVGSTLYILRSDGTLFEVLNYASKKFKVNSYFTGIPSPNNEGLCYDEKNNRLLIATKGKIAKGPEFKDKRYIYTFDLSVKKLQYTPLFELDVAEIKLFAEKAQIGLPKKTNKKGEVTGTVLKFRPSAIAIHPITKKLYLLSAADHTLFIFSDSGAIEQIEQLNPVLFNKSEGLTFFPNGDMIITNEGQDKKPTLLRFNYRD